MRIIKIKDKLGYAIIGTVQVIPDKNGAAVSTKTFDNGNMQYRFKVRGATRKVIRSDGITMWKPQRMWCNVGSQTPFADVARDLSVGDTLFIFGTISSSDYIRDTGGKRSTTFCLVEYLQVLGQPNGGEADVESDRDDDDDDFDF